MPKRNRYTNYSRISENKAPIEEETPVVDVPVEEAGQVSEPEEPVIEPVIEKVPETPKYVEKYGRVANCTAVNIRSAQSSESKILGSIPVNTKVTITGEENGYFAVLVDGIGKGFIKSEYLQTI